MRWSSIFPPTMPASFIRLAAAAVAAAVAAFILSGAALAADGCTYIELAELPVKYAGPALVPTIAGAVNGKPARMLMDTGSYTSALTRGLVETLKLKLHPTVSWVTGVGGETRLYEARIDDMEVGPTRSGSTIMRVIGEPGSLPWFDAIVGAPFLMQADLEVFLAERTIKFFRPRNCKDSFLAYWTDVPVSVIPYAWRYAQGENPQFTVDINGQKFDAIIDTGAEVSSISLAAARRAGWRANAPDVKRMPDMAGVGEGRAAHWSGRFEKIVIGKELITDVRLGVLDTETRHGADVYLGRDFLRAHRVLFASSQKKLYISYLGGEPLGSHGAGIEPWLQREADEGNPDAEYKLYRAYRAGANVPQDPEAATHWLELAASHGHAHARQIVERRRMAPAG
jgi:predicted aspartyl protease